MLVDAVVEDRAEVGCVAGGGKRRRQLGRLTGTGSRGKSTAQWEWLWQKEKAGDVEWRSAFFPEDAMPWRAGDETTSEAVEALHQRKWPVVREQLLWLSVLEQAVVESQHPKPEIHGPARAFILSRGFRTYLSAVALRSEYWFDPRAIRARLKKVWGVR